MSETHDQPVDEIIDRVFGLRTHTPIETGLLWAQWFGERDGEADGIEPEARIDRFGQGRHALSVKVSQQGDVA